MHKELCRERIGRHTVERSRGDREGETSEKTEYRKRGRREA